MHIPWYLEAVIKPVDVIHVSSCVTMLIYMYMENLISEDFVNVCIRIAM
jgi:hypothetical protein